VARELGKKIPSSKNIIRAVRISPEVVFVFRFPPDITRENALLPVDVFSLKGEFLGTTELSEVPLLISRRTMYCVRAEADGNVYLIRLSHTLTL